MDWAGFEVEQIIEVELIKKSVEGTGRGKHKTSCLRVEEGDEWDRYGASQFWDPAPAKIGRLAPRRVHNFSNSGTSSFVDLW